MKPYGVKRKDQGCCPGHDKFPKETYKTTSRKARKSRLRPAKKRERKPVLPEEPVFDERELVDEDEL